MLNVIWLFEYPTLNGGEHSLLATLPYLRAARVRVSAVAPPEGPLARRLEQLGVEFIPLRLANELGAREPLPAARRKLAEALASHRPDLLHANSLSMGRFCGPLARELRLPCVAHLRDIIGLSHAAIKDLNCNDRLLAVSAATRDFHVDQGLEPGRAAVLHNGVDLDRFRPRPAQGKLRRELGIGDEAVIIGTIGQLVMRKGHDILAQAAARLSGQAPRLAYVLIGERYSTKPEAVEYEARLRAGFAAFPERTHFLGVRDDVDQMLREIDILVHPARQEPLGRVLLEGAAAGKAIVATDVGGTREIFPPSAGAAILVPPNDPAALADGIAKLAANARLRLQLGIAARGRAVEGFDIATAAAGLLTHYREAASRG